MKSEGDYSRLYCFLDKPEGGYPRIYCCPDKTEGGYFRNILCLIDLKLVILGYTVSDGTRRWLS